jgi:hypothetical protein
MTIADADVGINVTRFPANDFISSVTVSKPPTKSRFRLPKKLPQKPKDLLTSVMCGILSSIVSGVIVLNIFQKNLDTLSYKAAIKVVNLYHSSDYRVDYPQDVREIERMRMGKDPWSDDDDDDYIGIADQFISKKNYCSPPKIVTVLRRSDGSQETLESPYHRTTPSDTVHKNYFTECKFYLSDKMTFKFKMTPRLTAEDMQQIEISNLDDKPFRLQSGKNLCDFKAIVKQCLNQHELLNASDECWNYAPIGMNRDEAIVLHRNLDKFLAC